MKTQKFILFFSLILTISMLITSCGDDTMTPIVEVDKNEQANDQLDGEWKVTSLRIDGSENIDWLYQKVTLEFDADKDAATGDFSWELVDFDGITEIISGDYEIKNDGEELELDGNDLALDVSNSDLDVEGNIDGFYWEIQADAK